MTKRSASSSPTEKHQELKRQKLEGDAKRTLSVPRPSMDCQTLGNSSTAEENALSSRNSSLQIPIIIETATAPVDQVLQLTRFANDETPKVSTPAGETAKHTILDSKAESKITKRKAGEGFEPWTPQQAHESIPPVQPHWGIVPRPGKHRPSPPQPSARHSNAAVEPILWENRKGGVRVKRGARYIGDYDQADHMYLQLMDLRPVSKKNQAPRRKAIGYFYKHGMPSDWNDAGPLNDLNKALQNAIKENANEKPWTSAERSGLAKLFSEYPEASIWDIAERFNDQIHPVNGTEEGQYPKGRFIESIRHEYLMYKSTYDKGETPTEYTEKDVPLEKIFAEKKAATPKKTGGPKKCRTTKKSAYPSKSDTAGVTNNQTILKSDNESQQPTVPMSKQPRLSDDEESMLELAGAYEPKDIQPSSPSSSTIRATIMPPSARATISSGAPQQQFSPNQTPTSVEESHKTSQVDASSTHCISSAEEQPYNTVEDAQCRVDAQLLIERPPVHAAQIIVAETPIEYSRLSGLHVEETPTNATTTVQTETLEEVVTEPAATADTTSENCNFAAREIEIDENYDDDDDLGDLCND